MKKTLKKQAALVMLSAAITAQTGFPGFAEATVTGNWKNENGTWKFYSPDQKAYTGWIKTANGWYYLDPADGKMAVGWKNIEGCWYYFDSTSEGIEGRMHIGWYQSPDHKWYFFNNKSGNTQEGQILTGWQWIDGYCYYFSTESVEQGAMYAGRKTPDGYLTNENGQWTQGHIVMQRTDAGFTTQDTAKNTAKNTAKTNTGGRESDSDSDGGSSSGGSNKPDKPGKPGTPDKPDKPETPDKPDNPDTPAEYQYVLMNIPYGEFYKAEIKGNVVPVDGVSSATKQKTRTGSLVGGSYHSDPEGTKINGVIYPVRIKKGTDLRSFRQITDDDSVTITVTNRGKENKTEYKGKDALFQSADHSYYILSETPVYYKELTVAADGDLSFGAVQTEKENVGGVNARLQTESGYGDYQMSFSKLPASVSDASEVYGVVLHTEGGEDYGLRHLENIWLKTNLAWSAGFVTTTHGNTLASAHYESMMGKTITGLTYYTNNGVQEITLEDKLYVPYKFNHAEFGVKEAAVESGRTEITGLGAIPADFDAEYRLTGPDGKKADSFTIADGVIRWNGNSAAGTYTLSVKDKKGKYAEISTKFILSTESIPVQAAADKDGVWALKAEKNASETAVASYLASITSVTVNGKKYASSGRGSVQIIDPNTGIVNTEAKDGENAIFEKGKMYEIEVAAKGYLKNLRFKMTAGEAPKPEGMVAEGSAVVETFGYEAKVKVTYDAETGKIVKVEDNRTEPGNNAPFWQNAVNGILSRFIGKTRADVGTVDTVSGATLSSNAIKKAVQNALPEEEKPGNTNMSTVKIVVDGVPHTYYYAAYVPLQTPQLIVNGEDVTAKAKVIRVNYSGKAYYYAEDDQKLTGKVYGLADVPYAEFYAGEKTGYTGPSPWSSSEDFSAGEHLFNSTMRRGGYDAVSSATTTKYGMYSFCSYSEKSGNGYKINGVLANVGIDADLFVRERILSEIGVSIQGNTFRILNSMNRDGRTLTSKEPDSYKLMYHDGMLSKMQYSENAQELSADGVKAVLDDKSKYGNYLIKLENLPEEVKGNDNVLGVLVKTGNGMSNIYGLEHLENIWKDADELAIAAKDGVESHGNKISYSRYSTMQEQTIESIVYLLRNYKALEIPVDLYCPKLLNDGQGIEAEDISYQADQDMSVKITMNLPDTYDPQIVGVKIGKTELEADTYKYTDSNAVDMLTIKAGKAKPGAYTVTFRDGDKRKKGYESVQAKFHVKSSLKEEDIALTNNRLVISGKSGVTVDQYRKAITAVYVDGALMKGVPGEQLILVDGSINFTLEYKKGSKTIKPFKNGADGSYKLKLEADGYPSVEAVVGSENVGTAKLADGTWYGTATDSFYYKQEGPDTVKAVIRDGKIESVESVIYKEDQAYRRGTKILDAAVGLDDLADLKDQLVKHKGTAYDAVSGATQTAKSQLSALENALNRSAKYQKDGIEQSVQYMEFEKRPNSKSDSAQLDLSASVLKVHLSDGRTKLVAFNEFADYGITTTPENGSTIPEVGVAVEVLYRHEESLTAIPAYVHTEKKFDYRYPTHMRITHSDQTTERVDLNQEDFRYKMKTEKSIDAVDLYDNEEKLVSATYDSVTNEWRMDLSSVNAGDMYNGGWKYKLYKLFVRMEADNSAFVSADIDTDAVQKKYSVGDKLDLSGLKALVTTEKGNKKQFDSWNELENNGFKSDPASGYEFTAEDIGTKTITISIVLNGKTVTESFEVKVTEAEAVDQTPAKIVLYSGDQVAKEIEVDQDAFVKNQGRLILRDEVISSSYKDSWKDFKIKVFNNAGELLNTNVVPRSNMLRVNLPDYKDADPDYGGYIMITFKATGDPIGEEDTDQAPARVVFSENGTKLAEVTISEADLKNGGGYVRKSNVKLPETYRGHLDQLEVTVYNADDVVLEHNLGIIRATYIQIRLPEYKAYEELGGSLTVSFEFVSTGAKVTAEKEIVNASEDPSVVDKAQESEDSTLDSAKQKENVQDKTDKDTSASADEPEITEAEENVQDKTDKDTSASADEPEITEAEEKAE